MGMESVVRKLGDVGLALAFAAAMCVAGHYAYDIRMKAINDYGRVIHEFDPWFNYRATEYLGEHGLAKFFKWYDYMSWYQLGRPVGTTIYPGMQMTSVCCPARSTTPPLVHACFAPFCR